MKFLIFLPIMLILLSGCSNKENSNVNNVAIAPQVSRTSVEDELTKNSKQEKEQELSSYSTKLLIKDSDRQTNVKLACSELNGKQVEPGETFSFTNTMGPATPEKGYEKADTFTKEGEIVQEYGGGKCQISSTLYNAVLEVKGLAVIERHEHSRDVDYVPEGKDAAVSYGSVDFKFRNDNPFPIKIYASSNEAEIIVRIVKIYYE